MKVQAFPMDPMIDWTAGRHEWDSTIWPHATAGFLKMKQNIPRILEQVRAA